MPVMLSAVSSKISAPRCTDLLKKALATSVLCLLAEGGATSRKRPHTPTGPTRHRRRG